jgi:exosortase F-associated protein
MSENINLNWQVLKSNPLRIVFIILSLMGLVLVFLFQREDFISSFGIHFHPYFHFIIKKVIRVLLNDTFMLLFIYSCFNHSALTKMAWKVQLIDTFILLPIYLILKLSIEGESEISSPLLSQLHRLIVNPILMILVIPAIYFQGIKK